MENTLHGSIHENYDHLLHFNFSISGETTIRINHNLITNPGVKFANIRRVFSHPVALNQCRNFFARHKSIEAISYYDTAGSVKMLTAEGLMDAAAIASESAAEIFGGVILRKNLEDDRRNFTRFFLLSKQEWSFQPSDRPWKTSLVFSTSNSPGALFRALACFALRDLSLSKIESRPLRSRPWEYLFYLDIAGNQTDPPVAKALAHLSEMTSFLRVLGSYQPTP